MLQIMAKEQIIIGETEARLFQIGIRCDYYITADGDCYSLSKGRLSKLRKLTPCLNGHKNPTIRVKVFEGDNVIVLNLPIYRIVYDIYSGVYHDWNVCKIQWIDGNPMNYSYDNMAVVGLKKHDELDIAKLQEFQNVYSKRFDDICRYINHRFHTVSIDDAKDITSDAFFSLCGEHSSRAVNFEAYWVRAAFRLSQKFFHKTVRQVSIEDERSCFYEPNYDYCNISIYDVGLSEQEKEIVGMLIKGYSYGEAVNAIGYKYYYQCPVKLYQIVEKFKKAFYEQTRPNN